MNEIGSPGDGSGSDRPQKRRKVDLACDECRARKVKCDGGRPTCDVCLRRKSKGAVCTYTTNPFRPQAASSGTALTPNHRQSSEVPAASAASNHERSHERPIKHTPSRSRPDEASSGSRAARGLDSTTDVSGHRDSNNHRLFGSNTGTFILQIQQAVDEKLGISDRHSSPKYGFPILALSRTACSNQRSNGTSDTSTSSCSYVLPSRRKADSLLNIYWTLVDPVYPFMDRKRFEEFYRSLWEGKLPRAEEKVFVATLNVVFALSSQLFASTQIEVREQDAKEYFERARSMVQLDMWDIGSMELVRCLLLMGTYLQSTNTPHQSWMVIGHAVRVAQAIGLHMTESSCKLQDKREQELARRLWHCCVMMDRTLSTIMGRPGMVSKAIANAVPLPEAVDIDNLHSKGHVSDRPQTAAFYVTMIKLYDIVDDILLMFYNPSEDRGQDRLQRQNKKSSSLDFASIFELDAALTSWAAAMPKHLQYPLSESSKDNSTFKRQAVIGRARFLYAKILLLRPVLSQFCLPKGDLSAGQGEESVAWRMALQCSGQCLRAAHDMIDLLHIYLDSETCTGPIPAWWYCVFYIYTAATVLLTARIHGLIASAVTFSPGDTERYSIDESWSKARSILKLFECVSPSAQRCAAALDVLEANVSRKFGGAAAGGGRSRALENSRHSKQQQHQPSAAQLQTQTQAQMNAGGEALAPPPPRPLSMPLVPPRYAPLTLQNREGASSAAAAKLSDLADAAAVSSLSSGGGGGGISVGGSNGSGNGIGGGGGGNGSSSNGNSDTITGTNSQGPTRNVAPTTADLAAAADFNVTSNNYNSSSSSSAGYGGGATFSSHSSHNNHQQQYNNSNNNQHSSTTTTNSATDSGSNGAGVDGSSKAPDFDLEDMNWLNVMPGYI